jgi:hypothetical protein
MPYRMAQALKAEPRNKGKTAATVSDSCATARNLAAKAG